MIVTRSNIPVIITRVRRLPGPVCRTTQLERLECMAETTGGNPIRQGRWFCPFRALRATGGIREIAEALARIEAQQKGEKAA